MRRVRCGRKTSMKILVLLVVVAVVVAVLVNKSKK